MACMPCMSWLEVWGKVRRPLGPVAALSPLMFSGDDGMVDREEKGDEVEDESIADARRPGRTALAVRKGAVEI